MLKIFLILILAGLAASSRRPDQVRDSLLAKYHTYDDLVTLLNSFQSRYPNISRVFSIGQSTEKRELLVFQITDHVNRTEPGEPMFKYVGNMHGDETVGREILISLIYHLLSNYGVDKNITDLVDNTNIFIMPSANPDGFEHSSEGSCDFSLGRENANQVDLNRNFPDQFDIQTSNETLFAGRENETVALMKWIMENKFVLSANLHAGAVVASYPFDDSSHHQIQGYYSASPDDDVFKHLALTYATSHKTMSQGDLCGNDFPQGITNGAHWYDVPGGMQDFNYLYSNCFEITLELTCCKYPTKEHLPEEWENNKDALINFMSLVNKLGIKGYVTDDSKGISPITHTLFHA